MNTKRKSVKPVSLVTSVRLSREEHAALKRIAEIDRRSLSNEIRFLIERREAELASEDVAA